MPDKDKAIKEGDLFAIPINDGFAVGLIARCTDSSILVYFLNRFYKALPILEEVEFDKKNIIYVVRASPLGLKKGKWPILGGLKKWDIGLWNVPVFYKKDAIDGTVYKVIFDDHLEFVKQTLADEGENIIPYPSSGLAGYGFVEKRLLRLMKDSEKKRK